MKNVQTRSLLAAGLSVVLSAGAVQARFTETRESTYTANKNRDPHPTSLVHVMTAERRFNDPVTLCVVYFNTFDKKGKGRVRAVVDVLHQNGEDERVQFNAGVAKNRARQCKQIDVTIKKGDTLVWEYEFESMPRLRSVGPEVQDFFNVLSVISSSGKLPDFTRRGPEPKPPATGGSGGNGGNDNGNNGNGNGGNDNGNNGGSFNSLTSADVDGLRTLLRFPAPNRGVALRFEETFLTIDWRRGSEGFHHIQNYPLAPGSIAQAVQEFVREVSQGGGGGRIGGPSSADVQEVLRLARWPREGRGVALRMEAGFVTNDSRINGRVRVAHGGKHGSLAAAIQAFLRAAPAAADD